MQNSVQLLRTVYPSHWGVPPARQTKDLTSLPNGFGEGSSTLARWIQQHLDADSHAALNASYVVRSYISQLMAKVEVISAAVLALGAQQRHQRELDGAVLVPRGWGQNTNGSVGAATGHHALATLKPQSAVAVGMLALLHNLTNQVSQLDGEVSAMASSISDSHQQHEEVLDGAFYRDAQLIVHDKALPDSDLANSVASIQRQLDTLSSVISASEIRDRARQDATFNLVMFVLVVVCGVCVYRVSTIPNTT